MINVLGDALAAGIMAHICRKDFAQDTGAEVRAGLRGRSWGGQGGMRSSHQRAAFCPALPASGLGLLICTGVTDSSNGRLLSTHQGRGSREEPWGRKEAKKLKPCPRGAWTLVWRHYLSC